MQNVGFKLLNQSISTSTFYLNLWRVLSTHSRIWRQESPCLYWYAYCSGLIYVVLFLKNKLLGPLGVSVWNKPLKLLRSLIIFIACRIGSYQGFYLHRTAKYKTGHCSQTFVYWVGFEPRDSISRIGQDRKLRNKYSYINNVRFKDLTAESMKMIAVWHIASCSIVVVDRRFRGVLPSTSSSNVRMMVAVRSSKTSVYFNKIAQRCIWEGCHLHALTMISANVWILFANNAPSQRLT
jgi:hypothetical protein